MIYNVGSLFSGIGGLDLGFERTGKFKTIWFSENDDYASRVLKKHWPEVPNLGDITKINWQTVERPDVLIGGFPCQDISTANQKGKGIEGARSGLWKKYFQAIGVLQPKIVVIENVSALIRKGLNVVLADLAQTGYDAEWFDLRASDIGAIHRRERIFIIAYPDRFRCVDQPIAFNTSNGRQPSLHELDSGIVADVDSKLRLTVRGGESNNAWQTNSTHAWRERIQRVRQTKVQKQSGFSWCENVRRIEDLFGRSDIPEPLLRGTCNGVSNYMERIKGLGNAVVPQVAQVVAERVLEVMEWRF